MEICACLRLLARLHYIMGDYAEVGLEPPLGYGAWSGIGSWQGRSQACVLSPEQQELEDLLMW